MDKDDWEDLKHFLSIAVDVHREIRKTVEVGKEQITIRQKAIERFIKTDPHPELFLKLGTFIGSRFPENTRELENHSHPKEKVV